jgi:hypothetical protein
MRSVSLTKRYKCKVCKELYIKERVSQQVCEATCAIKLIELSNAKKARQAVAKDRRETKAKLDAIKSKTELLRDAQTSFNAYIRARDAKLGCVSCDKPSSWHGQWHASHYKSLGARPELRFNVYNVHKACSVCNNYKSGNLIDYRAGILKRISAEKLDMLESFSGSKNYSKEQIVRIKKIFIKKRLRYEAKLQSRRL